MYAIGYTSCTNMIWSKSHNKVSYHSNIISKIKLLNAFFLLLFLSSKHHHCRQKGREIVLFISCCVFYEKRKYQMFCTPCVSEITFTKDDNSHTIGTPNNLKIAVESKKFISRKQDSHNPFILFVIVGDWPFDLSINKLHYFGTVNFNYKYI